MPELPEITVYMDALKKRVVGQRLEKVRIADSFLTRKPGHPVSQWEGRVLARVGRIGKRIILAFEPDFFALIHLMSAGRLHWKTKLEEFPGKNGLIAFDFENGTLLLTEPGAKKHVVVHWVRGEETLADFDPGGLETFDVDLETFAGVLKNENHTLKRVLIDQRLIKGIGNTYSDEILHRARLSPVKMTEELNPEELRLLFVSTRGILVDWIDRLRGEAAEDFPRAVTEFREGMAVHGRYNLPCPVCKAPIQRIVFAGRESNYCPSCQAEGENLSDRDLSKLLKSDWPEEVEALEMGPGEGEQNTDSS